MKASEFKNGSVKTYKTQNHKIELLRVFTKGYKGWYVSIFDIEGVILTLNQFHAKFNTAKKHYESLAKNFPVNL
jgi:D-Tyr-tRNAtyr deacylase